MNHDYGTRSRTAAKDRNSTVVDLTADESAGPSRPSQNDQPAQVRTYPVFWPYWNDDGVPVPAPLGLGGKDKASPSYPPPVPPAAERACEPSSSSASGRPIIECQESKGEEYPHEPQSGWLRRELEIVFKLRAKGHSFDEISKELSKLQPRKVAERDAKACELKWVELNNNKKTTKWTAEEEAELASFIKDDGMSWTDIEDKFCYRGKGVLKEYFGLILENSQV